MHRSDRRIDDNGFECNSLAEVSRIAMMNQSSASNRPNIKHRKSTDDDDYDGGANPEAEVRERPVSFAGIFQMEDLNSSADLTGNDVDGEADGDKGDGIANDSGDTGKSIIDRDRTSKVRSFSGDAKRDQEKKQEHSESEIIFQAIADGDVARVKEVLSSKAINLSAKNSQGATLLLAAVEAQNLEAVKALLGAGTDVDGRSAQGTMAIHAACRKGDIDTVRRLIAAGCDLEAVQDDGSAPLHIACLNGDASTIVQLLLDNGAYVRSTRTKDRISDYTALHCAAEVGDAGTLRILLDRWPEGVNAEASDASTPLHVACRHGYIDVTRTLLDAGAPVDAVARDVRGHGVTPLHVAVDNNHLFVAKALVDAGANVNAARVHSNREGVTSLHLAALKRNADVIKLLLESGGRPDEQDSDGATALHVAARTGQAAVVQLLVKHGADLNVGMASKQSTNQTPLHLAVRFRHYDVANTLIRAGCSVNLPERMAVSSSRANSLAQGQSAPKGQSGKTKTEGSAPVPVAEAQSLVDAYTPLHWAVENGDLDMVCLLLDNYAQPNTPAAFEDNIGLTPLHLACQDGYSRIAEELLRCPGCDRNPLKRTLNRENITPFHQATYNGHVDAVRVLLENGCDVNIQADNGYCALHYAAQQGNLEMTRMILKHGGIPKLVASAKDQLNITALHMAVQSGNASVVDALVEAGADIDSKKTMGDIHGVTPLHQAVYQEKSEIVETLLKLGASVNASMNGWYTPLHVAAEKGCSEIVTLLLQHSADPNARAFHKDHVRITPLHVAAQHGHTDVVRQLVEAGAGLQAARDFADRLGITALHLAVENGFEDTTRALVELGSDKNAQDSLKFTPLHVAVQYSFPSIVQFLLGAGCDTKRRTIAGLTPGKMADQIGNAAVRQLFKEERRKSGSFSFRQRRASNPNPTNIESNNNNEKKTSSLMRLFCGLNKAS